MNSVPGNVSAGAATKNLTQSYPRLLFFIITTGFLFSPGSIPARAQVDANPDCSADMLDIRILPPLEGQGITGVRALVIEIQNRAKSVCKLSPGPHIELLPQEGADSFTADSEDDETAAADFQKKQYDLAAGEVVHTIIAWPSRASWNSFPGCYSRDRLTLAFNFNEPTLLEVDHLWARLCDRAYVSRFRVGHYAGEGIPEEWLKRFQAQPVDFAVPTAPEQPSVDLETMLDREMLNDAFYSQVFLDLPHLDFDCPFIVLRKREADGKTKVYLNHCQAVTAEERSRLGFQDQKWSTRLDVSNMGMGPERPGQVEYEVISGVSDGEKRAYASAKTQALAMDPEPPELPVIESPLPDCRAAQLQVAVVSFVQEGGPWHEAHIYNLTNVSNQSCRVGGVPRLELLYPENQSHTANPKACPNCSDPLFQPRPSGWIDLRPGASAHFLVGTTRFDLNSGKWRMKCDVPNLRLILPGEDQFLSLPLGTGTCAELTVSAWRTGKYDGDPLNIEADKQNEKWQKTVEAVPLPVECEKKDFSKTGRPVIFPDRNGLEFGMSVEREHFIKGNRVGMHIWEVNPTDKTLSYSSCAPVFEMDVFDFYGHRVLSHSELKALENPEPGLQSVRVCSATMRVAIPPHTCSPSEGTVDLSEQYALPPGEYLITRKGQPTAEPQRPASSEQERQTVRRGIVISLDQQ